MLTIAGGILLAVLALVFLRQIVSLAVLVGFVALCLAAAVAIGTGIFVGFHSVPDSAWDRLAPVAIVLLAAFGIAAPLYVIYALGAAVWNVVTWRPSRPVIAGRSQAPLPRSAHPT